MTLNYERKNSLLAAKKLLLDLLDPKKTPRVPMAIRRRASAALRHFPWDMHIEELAAACPHILGDKFGDNHK